MPPSYIPLGFNHLLSAIHTRDADGSCGSHAHTATGADIFACARYSWRLGDIRAAAVCAGLAGVEAHAVVAVDEDIRQTVFNHKIEQFFSGGGMRPSIFIAVCDGQSVVFCGLLESFVVVGVATATILNSAFVIEKVNHFVKHGRTDILNRSCQRARADVDFMCAAKSRHPSVFVQREVSVCFWCALNGDGRS